MFSNVGGLCAYYHLVSLYYASPENMGGKQKIKYSDRVLNETLLPIGITSMFRGKNRVREMLETLFSKLWNMNAHAQAHAKQKREGQIEASGATFSQREYTRQGKGRGKKGKDRCILTCVDKVHSPKLAYHRRRR